MKNWVIALAILILPVVTYFVLEKNSANQAAFEVLAQADRPTAIKFFSSMCLDCKKLDVVTKEVMPKYADRVNYQAYNVQNNEKGVDVLIKKYGVTLVPTMIFVKKDGSVYKKTEGYLEKQQLEQILNALSK